MRTWEIRRPRDHCNNCVVGKFTLRSQPRRMRRDGDKTICVDCDRGFYLDTANGSTGCKECPRGFSQKDEGSAFCLPCVPGRAQPDRGQWNCTSCDPGLYAGTTQQQSCKECDRGKYVDFKEASKCIPCSRGAATNKTARSQCDECDAGYFRLNLGTPLATHAQQDGRWSMMGRRNATHVPRGHLPQRLRPSRVFPAPLVYSKTARRTARACGVL